MVDPVEGFRKINHTGPYDTTRGVCREQPMVHQMNESVRRGAFLYISILNICQVTCSLVS